MKSSNELKPLWTPDPKNVMKTNLSLFGNKAAGKYCFKEVDYDKKYVFWTNFDMVQTEIILLKCLMRNVKK